MNTSFERVMGGKSEWLTPPGIIGALGEFDLDPCAPVVRPFDTARHHFTVVEDGLLRPWFGRVWCNPPYGREIGGWLKRMAGHGNGVLLVFARTETENFFRYVWPVALGIMFLRGRLTFLNVDGSVPVNHAGAPSCLVAYGRENAEVLKNSGLRGKFLYI
jgi:hypothetical protein